MIKSFIKIILVFLAFSLFACQNYIETPNLAEKPKLRQEISSSLSYDKGISHDQFQSRNLETAKEAKKKTQIALFLPISGKNKELGTHLFNAAVLSLFENDKDHNIELVLIDSKDSPQEAAKAFQKIINAKIKIVIGPVFSNAIDAVKESAKKYGITLISLSNNHQLLGNTNNQGGVFLAGLMLESQIDKIINYAMRHDKKNFAVIAPNNQYGLTVADILKDTVTNRDGNFAASEVYEFHERGLEKAVERVVNSFTIPSHLAEGGGNKIKKGEIIDESHRAYTQVILVPESGKILSKIAKLVKESNKSEREIKLIGTNQWDELSTLNDDNLIGAWFPAPKADKFRNFEKKYYQSYSKFPPRIASIPYDLIALISKMAGQKIEHNLGFRDFVSGNLIKNGFDGIDGQFRFLPNGYVQRNLAILEVSNGAFNVLEEPAKIFLQY